MRKYVDFGFGTPSHQRRKARFLRGSCNPFCHTGLWGPGNLLVRRRKRNQTVSCDPAFHRFRSVQRPFGSIVPPIAACGATPERVGRDVALLTPSLSGDAVLSPGATEGRCELAGRASGPPWGGPSLFLRLLLRCGYYAKNTPPQKERKRDCQVSRRRNAESRL